MNGCNCININQKTKPYQEESENFKAHLNLKSGSPAPTWYDNLRGPRLLVRALHQQSDEDKQVPWWQHYHSDEQRVPAHGHRYGPSHQTAHRSFF